MKLNTLITAVLIIGTAFVGYIVVTDYFKTPEPSLTLQQPLQQEPTGFLEGDEHAPLTLYKFFDYSCNFCEQYADLLTALQKEADGNFKIIHVPMPIGNESTATYNAAATSICSYFQSQKLTAHNYFYAHQEDLQNALNVELPNTLIQDGENDNHDFQHCMDNQLYSEMINNNRTAARELGISSVPALLINNHIYIGALPKHRLRSLLKFHLSKEAL